MLKTQGYKIEKIKKFSNNNILQHNPQVLLQKEIEEFLNLKINFITCPFIIEGFGFIKKLKDYKAAVFSFDTRLGIEIENVNYNINSWEELFILNEVYVEGIYNLIPNEEFTFIDIGMNVGITSLFFAKNNFCNKVFAYEPFEKTFSLGRSNFELNNFPEKIYPYNYGLGFPERTLNIEYNEKYKGSVGINGLASYIEDSSSTQNLQLEIRDIASEIDMIKNQFIGKAIMKIDCEGAEYEIFQRLETQKLISLIDVYMIEWHIEGPNPLVEILKSNNYKILSFNESSTDIGMIYAFK
ncbi:FkbM family methyltransferase [Chryseobacterium sp.]|uniref:FkbM family methyltransferase n=1 Tax=Chryseobacterium sp. TaxID=1871047 RepID=UPI00289C7F32|nr:FkbM family methyltransferase [Chryseobacterium sp.]